MLKKLIGTVAAFFGIMTGLDWAWEALKIQTPPQVWAMTATTLFFTVYMAVGYCAYRQQTLKQRIEECAKAKARLEKMVLKKRLSSKR